MNIRPQTTPNKEAGRRGHDIRALVIHMTEGSSDSAISWIRSPRSQVSYHYLITATGIVYQFVKDSDTAWHAGFDENSNWALHDPSVNSNLPTIGIGLAGFAAKGPTLEQAFELIKLCRKLCKKWSIPIDNDHILPHNIINTAKTCPGGSFPLDSVIGLVQLGADTPAVCKP